MELLEYWNTIYKRLWLIILLVIAGAAAGYHYAQQEEVLYRTSTVLFLNPMADNPMWPYRPVDGATLAISYSDFIRDGSFAYLVAQQLGLSTDEVRGTLTTDYESETQYFYIIATHPDPDVAQQLSQTAAETFIAENAARMLSQQQQFNEESGNLEGPGPQQITQLQIVLQQELTYINDQISRVQAEIADLQGQSRSERLNDRVRDLIAELFRLRNLRADILSNMSSSIIEPAPVPANPLPRKTVTYMLQGIAVAMVLGAGLAFLWEYLDYTFRKPEALSALYGIPVQSVIGRVAMKSKKKAPSGYPALVTLNEPLSPNAEAFRALRLGLSVARSGTAVRSLLLTSAVAGEGKTFIAANLAASMAQNGRRVILVDANLRRPEQHTLFELPQEPGFTNLIYDQRDDFMNFLQPTSIENLWLLPSGIILPNSPDLLGSAHVVQVMEQLGAHADIVIYDTPAVTNVTDALVLAPRMDAVLQVVMAGRARINRVLACKAVLEHVGAPVIGPIFNRAKKVPSTGYYTSSRAPERAAQTADVQVQVGEGAKVGRVVSADSVADSQQRA